MFKAKETEFTKIWIARFTIVIFVMLLFYLVLSQELIAFHLISGLDYDICKLLFNQYSAVVKVAITGYSVTFIGSMIKAFAAKQQEEANKLKSQAMMLDMEDDFSEEEEV